MPAQPKISVLMPAYNAERFISKAIESIVKQTWSNIELLVMDDASKDDTVSVLKAFKDPRLKFFSNEKNLGYLKTCNKLFDLAQGDFIAFQDADDYSDVVRLETQMQQFAQDPQLAVCGTNLAAVHEDGTPLYCSMYFTTPEKITANMLEGGYSMIPNSFVFKREILTAIGKYNEYWDRIGAEDYYWAWLIMERYKLINIQPALYYYRLNPQGITGDWSDNRRKLHNRQLLPWLFKTRAATGTDPIEQKDWAALDSFIKQLDQPYLDDPSLYYREMAKRDFYSGNKKRALKLLLKGIGRSPFNSANFRDFFYYLRTRAHQH